MNSPHLPAPSPTVTSSSYTSARPRPAPSGRISTTRLLRAVVARLRPASRRGGAARWRDRRTAWLELPPGWTRGQVNDLAIGVPGFAPGGTTLLLVVEPVHAVASGSIEADFERAASAPGVWSASAVAPVRRTVDGWTLLLGDGDMELDGARCPAVTAVARRGALRARFWALADSEDTRERYRAAVMSAVASVRRFAEGAARDSAG